MNTKEQKLEAAYNAINYDGDTMPELEYETGTGFIFEGVTAQNLAAFKKANNLPDEMQQGEVEAWIDKKVGK